jgi:hypothetical protein
MVLKTIMDKMNEINRKVEGLHEESMQAVNATQDYAEHVEAAMKVRHGRSGLRLMAVGRSGLRLMAVGTDVGTFI